jgi:hypothetical protein
MINMVDSCWRVALSAARSSALVAHAGGSAADAHFELETHAKA